MAVRGVDDVDIAPDERPAGRGKVSLGIRAALVLVRMVVLLAGASARGERDQEKGE